MICGHEAIVKLLLSRPETTLDITDTLTSVATLLCTGLYRFGAIKTGRAAATEDGEAKEGPEKPRSGLVKAVRSDCLPKQSEQSEDL